MGHHFSKKKVNSCKGMRGSFINDAACCKDFRRNLPTDFPAEPRPQLFYDTARRLALPRFGELNAAETPRFD
jgi:hypothetical protein